MSPAGHFELDSHTNRYYDARLQLASYSLARSDLALRFPDPTAARRALIETEIAGTSLHDSLTKHFERTLGARDRFVSGPPGFSSRACD
jgi:hypothetical protein